MEDGVTAYNN